MITIGTKVAILPCDDYRNRFIGTQGIVQKYYHNKVGVKIDGCKIQKVSLVFSGLEKKVWP